VWEIIVCKGIKFCIFMTLRK